MSETNTTARLAIAEFEEWLNEELKNARCMMAAAEEEDDEGYDFGFYDGSAMQCIKARDRLKILKQSMLTQNEVTSNS